MEGDQVEPGTTTGSPTQAEQRQADEEARLAQEEVLRSAAAQSPTPSENEGVGQPPGVPVEIHDAVQADLEAVRAERDQLQEQLDEAQTADPALAAEEEQPAEGSTAADGLPSLAPSADDYKRWQEQGFVGEPDE